ncbi:MAG: hypothetical protein HY712_01420 [candidate division NC10 bacterium]|nr:hypothetical protein [candidate division NC10 bacterium]
MTAQRILPLISLVFSQGAGPEPMPQALMQVAWTEVKQAIIAEGKHLI